MSLLHLITENQLDEWVRGHAQDAQRVIVELVWRLVAASSPHPRERRFPLGDSIGQHGPDGVLDAIEEFNPFIPEGRSYWEIGTNIDAGDKATSDYKSSTAATPIEIRRNAAFIFVTPLSGRRDWQYTWKEEQQATWLENRRQLAEWRDIRIIDGTKLIDWLHSFPAVERWLAGKMGRISINQAETPTELWDELKTIGEPPPLPPELFLVNREEGRNRLADVFSGTIVQLRLDTHFPDQIPEFVAAHLATLNKEENAEAAGRCIILNSIDAWQAVLSLLTVPHVFVANFAFEDTDVAVTRLLQRTQRMGHAIIFRGLPGGIPHPNRVKIVNPKSYEIQQELEKAGYLPERARVLAQKSDGNIGSLLRCIQNLSIMPEWSQGTAAAELAVAVMLGSWSGNTNADQSLVEKLSGEPFGEWVDKLRAVTLLPATPLMQREGAWKFISRYEGWYSLGPRIHDDILDRFQEITITALSESDPQFDLPPNERYMANFQGKTLAHSSLLRQGLAESLALLGSHSAALISCSAGKAEATANIVVRKLLASSEWIDWASMDRVLPLLAEAAPEQFLSAVENSLKSSPCPFDMLFAQEGDGLTGGNCTTGLLWALETLAWDNNHFTRVMLILGGLADRDPGGKWVNRPSNSLTTILLPWLPQTCAPITKRLRCVELLLARVPGVAWKLILTLLPDSHQSSSGTHKPTWRSYIPDNWTNTVKESEYWTQANAYFEMALNTAKNDCSKLIELIRRIDDFPPPSRDEMIGYLKSDSVLVLPDEQRIKLWTELVALVSKHRKFSDAEWALEEAVLARIDEVIEYLRPHSPFFLHQRLFGEREWELLDERGDYQEQFKALEVRRQSAVNALFLSCGINVVLKFAQTVDLPWRVGFSFGATAPQDDIFPEILPIMLLESESTSKALSQFAGGFVQGRYTTLGWKWVDGIDMTQWDSSQIGQFLSYLPFTFDTWNRVDQLLGTSVHYYWTMTNVNPYEPKEGLEYAIDLLVQHGRPNDAVRCLEAILHEKKTLNITQAMQVLKALLKPSTKSHGIDDDAVLKIIKALQNDEKANPEELLQIEWAYLPLLDQYRNAAPRFLELRLAKEPEFFCEIIRIIFKSNKAEQPPEESTEERKIIARNAYELLRKWKTPPGIQPSGSFDGDIFFSWIERVKKACAESGHLEIALTMVGHVLIHAPKDPDGLWIHHSVAQALNDPAVDDMRNGFRTELFNSRGVHSWTAGKEEIQLSEQYKQMAEDLEEHGYINFSVTLRNLADSYARDAEREAARDPFDSWNH